MKFKPMACVLAMSLFGFGISASSAYAGVHEIRFDAEQKFSLSNTIAAGDMVEVCGDFQKGETIQWSFQAEHPLDFNIHFHVGKKVNFPAKLKQQYEANGKLKTKLHQTYCWMWTNTSKEATPLNLQLSLQQR